MLSRRDPARLSARFYRTPEESEANPSVVGDNGNFVSYRQICTHRVGKGTVNRNATGLFLFLSPTVTFKRIIRERSTEQFSGIPYVMTLLNCLLSAWYGLPFISKDNYLVTAINGAGAAIESVYVIIFLIFAPKREKAKIAGLLICVLAIFSTIASVSVLAFRDGSEARQKRELCGYAATVFSIVMYASPLSIMRLVIRSKSVEYMPFLLSLFVFLCGTSWFIYGLIGNDKFLYIPNGFGSLLGLMQLLLYAIYRSNKGTVDTNKPTADGSLKMGRPKSGPQEQPNSFPTPLS